MGHQGWSQTSRLAADVRFLLSDGDRAMPSLIFRKGLDLKAVVAGELAEDYHSELVDRIKASTYRYTSGRLTVYLAREFGFCYGVDRAVDYAYQDTPAVSGSPGLPHGRDHSQRACEWEAARRGDPFLERSG